MHIFLQLEYSTRMPTKVAVEPFALILIAHMETKSPELGQIRRKTFSLYFFILLLHFSMSGIDNTFLKQN
jgi:hypothetical protein